MSAQQVTTAGPTRSREFAIDRLRQELEWAVRDALVARGVVTAEDLAQRLDILPFTADGLLHRPSWPIETSLWIASKLNLGLRVSLTTA